MKDLDSATHLSKTAKQELLLTDTARIARIRHPRWIKYDIADEVLELLTDLLNYPPKHRMPNILLYGDTNNGKTMIVNQFLRKYPTYNNPSGDRIIVPVLIIQAPEVPDEGRFYNAILEALLVPFRHSDRPDKKRYQVLTVLKQIGIRMLIIDEIQDILDGRPATQQLFLNAMKHLANDLMIPIVGVGTREALTVIVSDPQLRNRFEPILLPRWIIGDQTDPRNPYLRLLANFEKSIPLWEPSGLTKEEMALELLRMSEGLIGELVEILTRAAVLAVKTKKEKITIDLLKQIRWSAPSERKATEQAIS